jgi:ssDNA-binding Zn-finger/Zn-ribbon topoisomerase 1
VKALEEFGIGRPSTYASIISTLKDREYVILDKKRFLPTDTGDIVNKFLTEHFSQYVDYNFTAKLENQLDDIASGQREWVPVMDSFWKGFSKQIAEKESISRAEVTTESLDEACPKCSKPLSIKFGKRGRFIACTGYPDCDYTRNMGETAEQAAEEAEAPTVIEDRVCPDCGGALHIKKGRYGSYRLRQLPQVQAHRTAGKTATPAWNARVQVRPPDRAQEPLRQAVLQLQYLSQVQVRHLEPAGRRALPQVQLADSHHQDHQASWYRESLPAEGMRLQRGNCPAGSQASGRVNRRQRIAQ